MDIKENMDKFAVIGLGYVGLRVATSLAEKKLSVIGYDISEHRVSELQSAFDHNLDVNTDTLANISIEYTTNANDLKQANFYFVDIDTPVDDKQQPDLSSLCEATKTLAKSIAPGDIIVYESTVYPGATEEVLIPLLEKYSDLKHNEDFFVSYSPERVVPGDKEHGLINTVKLISATDQNTLEKVKSVYENQLDIKTCSAKSIKVAETAKLFENIQRDVNIALSNEMAIFANNIGIKVSDVIEAATSKWNFHAYHPGLVGGHCIPVDPYYLLYKASIFNTKLKLIETARNVNDGMVTFIQQVIQRTHESSDDFLLMGLSFKENISDTRNSLAVELFNEIKNKGKEIKAYDPIAYLSQQQDLKTFEWSDIQPVNIMIITVAHDLFKQMGFNMITKKINKGGLLIDIPGLFKQCNTGDLSFNYWSF